MREEDKIGMIINCVVDSICSVIRHMFLTEQGGGLSAETLGAARDELIEALKELSAAVAIAESKNVSK